ncbi:MAG TPA: hypothetical protein VF194_08790 [Ferrovibrio sp.]|uniref:hypothetical protein n=1 Tax=Ferrovibrio sp. TaxID=1917215 RepID=UPI002ECFF563
MEYLIDPSGRWWRWPSFVLAEQLGYSDPDFDLAGYAARNLGYVWVLQQPEATFLQFRAGMISPAAVNALRPYLQKAVKAGPVGLVYFASGWLEEAFAQSEPLIARLDELASFIEPRSRDLFIRKSYNPWQWLQDCSDDLTGLFTLWRAVGEVFSDPIQAYLQRTGLASRTVFVRPNPYGELLVQNSGAGFTVYDGFSFHVAEGRKLEDQPDRAYGRWVREAYAAALHDGDPRIDDIDAIVEQPDHDPRRRRYRRVILRWREPNGGMILTGSSLLNQNIAIPLDFGRPYSS